MIKDPAITSSTSKSLIAIKDAETITIQPSQEHNQFNNVSQIGTSLRLSSPMSEHNLIDTQAPSEVSHVHLERQLMHSTYKGKEVVLPSNVSAVPTVTTHFLRTLSHVSSQLQKQLLEVPSRSEIPHLFKQYLSSIGKENIDVDLMLYNFPFLIEHLQIRFLDGLVIKERTERKKEETCQPKNHLWTIEVQKTNNPKPISICDPSSTQPFTVCQCQAQHEPLQVPNTNLPSFS